MSGKVEYLRRAIDTLGVFETIKRLFYCNYEVVLGVRVLSGDLENHRISNNDKLEDYLNKKDLEIADLHDTSPDVIDELEKHYDKNFRRLAEVLKKDEKNEINGYLSLEGGIVTGYVYWIDNRVNPGVRDEVTYRVFRNEYAMEEDDAYALDLYILPEFRGRGSGLLVVKKLLMGIKEKGYKQVFSLTHKENNPSRKIQARLGFREIDTYRIHKLFLLIHMKGWRIYFHPTPRLIES